MNEFLKALKDGTAYDFIANNYTDMSRRDLKNILLECLYNMDKDQLELVADVLEDDVDEV